MMLAFALFAAAAGAVTGCGSEQDADTVTDARDTPVPGPTAEVRARQVADAWDGSEAAEVWGKGYYPMGESVQLPEEALQDEAARRAYATQNFVLRGELPTDREKAYQVTWARGGSLTLPLMDARTAYETVARGGNDGPRLAVTGAKLGEMTVATSRGPATVPAWLFTLEGYDAPLKRAAVSPSKLPEPPIGPAAPAPTRGLAPLGRLIAVTGDGRSVTVLASHGSCDGGPAVDVLETDGSVVLSASVVDAKNGPCTAEQKSEEVTVQVDRPVGERVVLDAFTGRPVPYGERNQSSPSWS